MLDAGANVNQTTHYGWTALLTATQNRHYKLASYLLEKGANPNIANNGGWSPLYIATDNRNIEGGDYPVRKPDMDHLDFIKALLDKGANVNARVCGIRSTPTNCTGDTTETRTNFTMQWLQEDGATPFLRASQSGDVELMKLLLAHGADPKITTAHNVSALAVASGIAWVEGVTYEWSPEQNLEAVKMMPGSGRRSQRPGRRRARRSARRGAQGPQRGGPASGGPRSQARSARLRQPRHRQRRHEGLDLASAGLRPGSGSRGRAVRHRAPRYGVVHQEVDGGARAWKFPRTSPPRSA